MDKAATCGFARPLEKTTARTANRTVASMTSPKPRAMASGPADAASASSARCARSRTA